MLSFIWYIVKFNTDTASIPCCPLVHLEFYTVQCNMSLHIKLVIQPGLQSRSRGVPLNVFLKESELELDFY